MFGILKFFVSEAPERYCNTWLYTKGVLFVSKERARTGRSRHRPLKQKFMSDAQSYPFSNTGHIRSDYSSITEAPWVFTLEM
jgi:hypothetical protein